MLARQWRTGPQCHAREALTLRAQPSSVDAVSAAETSDGEYNERLGALFYDRSTTCRVSPNYCTCITGMFGNATTAVRGAPAVALGSPCVHDMTLCSWSLYVQCHACSVAQTGRVYNVVCVHRHGLVARAPRWRPGRRSAAQTCTRVKVCLIERVEWGEHAC